MGLETDFKLQGFSLGRVAGGAFCLRLLTDLQTGTNAP